MSNEIAYGFSDSPFGDIVVARTEQGLCDLQFLDYNRLETIHELAARWGKYTPTTQDDDMARRVARMAFAPTAAAHATLPVPLDLRGTAFQLRVWQALLQIPFGQTRSYQQVADAIGEPTAVRAVASAIAQNPIAVLVPCHRVVRSDGTCGEYHWGRDLKRRLIDWEQAQQEQ